jgi:hypothetical protein
MKAIEFTTILEAFKIQFPELVLKDVQASIGKNARVILLIDEPELYEEKSFQNLAEEQFLKGYSDSDAIYDKV